MDDNFHYGCFGNDWVYGRTGLAEYAIIVIFEIMSKESWYNSVSMKIGFFIGLVVVIFSGIAIYRESIKKNQIKTEIDRLKKEAEAISKKNSDIQDKIAYFQSREYMEIEAKDKLNLKSPDEQVVVIKPGMAVKEAVIEPDIAMRNPEVRVAVSNSLKWWNYFFKY